MAMINILNTNAGEDAEKRELSSLMRRESVKSLWRTIGRFLKETDL